jgi:hypothetical protein
MAKYQILIHCKGLSVPSEESDEVIGGFYTTRYGTGSNEKEAFENIINELIQEEGCKKVFSITKDTKGNEPIFEMEKYEIVPFYKGKFKKTMSYTFYPV